MANIIQFVREAGLELKKVVWPNKQETMQTTLAVLVMVVIMGLLLWTVDGLLLWIVSKLTGLNG